MDKHINKLKEEVKKISKSSGVILAECSRKGFIRWSSNKFKKSFITILLSNTDPRIKEMMSLARKVKVIETKTLLEAIILEAKY